jgi:hypothetical protein
MAKVLVLSVIVAAVALFTTTSHAIASTTLKCSKKGKTISQIIAALAPANGYTEIDISGSCIDNIYIPPNQSILLVAANGTTLKPLDSSTAAFSVEGRLQINNLTVSVGSAAAVNVYRGGIVTLLAGSLTGTSIVLQISNASEAIIEDTALATTNSIAINLSSGSVEIDGIAGLLGSNNAVITNSGAPGLYCAQGNVTIGTGGGGNVIFNGGGLGLVGCNLKAVGSAANPIIIQNTGTTGGFLPGIGLTGGEATVIGAQIINNNNFGIYTNEGADLQLSADTITGNVGAAMEADQNAMIHIVPYAAINTISEPGSNTLPLFNCFQGGKIYVTQVAGSITPAPTQANSGCLTVGGP